jgi:hypothetical protein
MRVLATMAALALSAALAALPSACSRAVAAADPAHPVVVELFQSQGCSSCPPANANLAAIADHADVLALNFSVTYWDDLGWKDTFAQPAYTARQWDYAHAFGRNGVFTPQIVVDGRKDGVGVDPGGFARLVAAGGPATGGPAIELAPTVASLAAATPPAHPADVWLVRYDPRVIQVAISRGENTGKTLPHKNIVRQLTRLGAWNGGAARFILPPAGDPVWRTAILVQLPNGGPILAAAKA